MLKVERVAVLGRPLSRVRLFGTAASVDSDATGAKQQPEIKKKPPPKIPRQVRLIGVYEKSDKSRSLNVNDSRVLNLLEKSGFEGKNGQLRTFFNAEANVAEDALAVVGLGKHPRNVPLEEFEEKENIRKAYASAIKKVATLYEANELKIIVDASCTDLVQEIAEGTTLASYKYNALKSAPAKLTPSVDLDCTQISTSDESRKDWDVGCVYANAQNLARRLADAPANHMTPTLFCEKVINVFEEFEQVEVLVHGEEWMEKKGMGGLLAIAKGSSEPPKFLQIRYWGKAKGDEEGCVALVGKGVTFDAGGISLKPSGGMALMKGDMMGAAAVAASVFGAASLRLPLNIVAVIPLTENLPDGKAVKPGDVITTMMGKTVEIDNTDAEGRVILADALYYVSKTYKPHTIIDVATLTGAIDVALGGVFAGLFTNSDKLAAALLDAGKASGDRLWRMPLDREYLPLIKSDVADLKNVGSRSGGAITAAMFLSEFVPGVSVSGSEHVSWAHLDIAGVMHNKSATGYLSAGMTGRTTRSILKYLQNKSRNVPVPV